MIKAVLFDWGGVLVSGGHSFRQYMEEKVGSKIPQQHLIEYRKMRIALNKGELGEADFDKRFCQMVGIESTPEDFWKPQDIIHILPEMKYFCDELRGKGIKTGIISNMGPKLADAIESAGGYKYFNPLVVSSRVGLCKPEEEIFDLSLEKLGLQPQEVIYIDDLEVNLEYPRELGMKTVFARNSEQIINDVNSILG